MYLASVYEWPAIRSFHAAVLLEIERGRLNWGDSFLHLENRTLAGLHKKTKEQTCPTPSNSRRVCALTLKIIMPCLEGTRNGCVIFAACWVKDKVKWVHSEYSDDCPNKPKANE